MCFFFHTACCSSICVKLVYFLVLCCALLIFQVYGVTTDALALVNALINLKINDLSIIVVQPAVSLFRCKL